MRAEFCKKIDGFYYMRTYNRFLVCYEPQTFAESSRNYAAQGNRWTGVERFADHDFL